MCTVLRGNVGPSHSFGCVCMVRVRFLAMDDEVVGRDSCRVVGFVALVHGGTLVNEFVTNSRRLHTSSWNGYNPTPTAF